MTQTLAHRNERVQGDDSFTHHQAGKRGRTRDRKSAQGKAG